MKSIAPYFSPTSLFGVSAIDVYTGIYTPLVILMSFGCLMLFQTFGNPIICTTTDDMTKPDLIEKHNLIVEYCSREGQFFVDTVRHLPTVGDYQWIPLFLVMSFIGFFVPHFGWLMSRRLTMFPFSSAMHTLMVVRGMPQEKSTQILSNKMKHLLQMRSNIKTRHRDGCMTTPISILYIIFKLLILLCTIPIYLFIFGALAMDPTQMINTSVHTTGIGIFAKIVTCYFPYEKVAQPGVLYTCVLKFNTICEKIFIILFFWLTAMLILNVFSTFYWIRMLISTRRQKNELGEWFRLGEPNVCMFSNQKRVDRFMRLLGSDTWLLLTLSTQRGGMLVAAKAMSVLWKSFIKMEDESRSGLLAPQKSTAWLRKEDSAADLPIVTGVLADASLDSGSLRSSDYDVQCSSLP